MKRTTAILLCAIMVLGMIPSSLLSVIAADNGVIQNDRLNQSLNNAATQAIPESVTIDGNIDADTAWANNEWNEVDKSNGTWNTDSPSEESKKLTYKYQLHYDYEYFYGAIVLGDGIKTADITVWLKDGSNAAGGYSHKINYTVNNGTVTDGGMVDYNGTAVGDASLPAQKYLVAYGEGGNVTIEFRRYLDSFTSADASDIEYFVSVTYSGNTLYYPRIKVEGEVLSFAPTYEFWPTTDGDNHLDFQEHKDKLSPINVDGNFDEAAWAGLSDFYLQAEDPNLVDEKDKANKGTVGFSTIGTQGSQGLLANTDGYRAYSATTYASGQAAIDNIANDFSQGVTTVISSDGLGLNNQINSEGVRFKYEYRLDGEYLYIAVVAEVPKMIYTYATVGGVLNNGLEVFDVKAEPNLTIQFYNQTGKYFLEDKTQITENVAHDGWAVEHLITYETYRLMAGETSYKGSFDNVTSRVSLKDGVYQMNNVNWWGSDFAGEDRLNQDMSRAATGFESAASYQGHYGDFGVWYFESRVKLDSVMSSSAIQAMEEAGLEPGDEGFDVGDLAFTIAVHDRRWIHPYDFGSVEKDGKTYPLKYAYRSQVVNSDGSIGYKWYYSGDYNRNVAWTGTDGDNLYSNTNYIFVNNADCKGNDTVGIVVDGNLDKRNNAALAGADYYIDSTYRDDNAYPDANMQYTYILTADHEYLYGAAVITNGSTGTQFRLWTNCNDSTTYENVLDFSIKDFSTGTVELVSWYSGGKNIIGDKANCDVKVVGVKVNETDVRLEFRVALSEIGCVPTLSPAKNQKLLSYYVSVEKYGNSQNQGLIHPRCLTFGANGWDSLHEGRIFYNDSFDKDSLYVKDQIRAYDHNDNMMLRYIAIDGKLEEEIWNDASDRILVNGDSGKWTVTPTKNDVFEYSYAVYAGDNYIYGAVELDVEAIAKDLSGKDFTRIEIWFSNPGAFDEWGIYDENRIFDNYLFDIYFVTEEYANTLGFAVPSFPTENGNVYVYGGSTPGTTEQYYKWGMTSANGKTYAEFMISTDCWFYDEGQSKEYTRFNIAEDYGFDYYVNVIHPTETGETLSLTYPVANDMFYLTHLNTTDREGLGVIFTDYALYSSIEQYRWWTHVLFKPAANGNWEVVDVRLTANQGKGNPTKFTEAEFNAAGGFIYCLNYGNNYIQVMESLRSGFKQYLSENNVSTEYATLAADQIKNKDSAWQTARANYLNTYITAKIGQTLDDYFLYEKSADKEINYYSLEAYYMDELIEKNWKTGVVINIPGLASGSDVATQVQTMLDNQTAAQEEMLISRYVDNKQNVIDGVVYVDAEISYVDPTKTNIKVTGSPVQVTDIPYYYESGYKHIFKFEFVSENTDWDNYLPTESVWNTDNHGSLDALEFDNPEKITVDGKLNDTGWDAEQWITVNHGINATLQSNASNAFRLKYQMRVDGEKLYVAAVFEGVAYTAENSPNFWLWINDDADVNQSFSRYYKIGYKWDGMETYALWDCIANHPEIPDLPDYFSYPDGGYSLSENYKTSSNGSKYILYDNLISVRDNNSPTDPVGGNDNSTVDYEDSLFYGYTDVIEESVGGRYYPDINIQRDGYLFGEECAVMNGDNGNVINGVNVAANSSTVVEFCIDLDEIDAERDGFEYFVSASRMSDGIDFTMFYPNVYCEPDSDYSYHNLNMPFWKWYSDTSAKFTAEDYAGDTYMSNEYAPVVTLGAKFNSNFSYTDDKGVAVENVNAIRFGGVYHESMIRRQSGDDTTNYWDVTDMGIVVVPTAYLGNAKYNESTELTLDTVGAKSAAAVGIVDWASESNFADYESFAFYVTVPDIPDKASATKLSARTYICYRDLATIDGKTHGTNAKDCYGQTIVRSIDLIETYADGEQTILPD